MSAVKKCGCSNDRNIFCYICGSFTLSSQQCEITNFVKKVYFAYFKVKLGDQDKSWAPHKVCKSCMESLRYWSQGKDRHLKFGIPMIWREQKIMSMIATSVLSTSKDITRETNTSCNILILPLLCDLYLTVRKYRCLLLLNCLKLMMKSLGCFLILYKLMKIRS